MAFYLMLNSLQNSSQSCHTLLLLSPLVLRDIPSPLSQHPVKFALSYGWGLWQPTTIRMVTLKISLINIVNNNV